MKESSVRLQKASNFLQRFIEECFEFDPMSMVSRPDFTTALRAWWEEDHGQTPPSEDAIGRSLSSMYEKRIASDNTKLRYNNIRYYAGIKMTEQGLSYWEAESGVAASTGRSRLRMSTNAEDVNKTIPESWNNYPVIKTMRENHRK